MSSPTPAGPRPRRPLVRALGIGVGGAVLAVGAWTTFLVWPRSTVDPSGTAPVPPAERVDAVVMLAGADDGRHELVRSLIRRGAAPVVVVSNPDGPGEPLAHALCRIDPPPGVEAVCVEPRPATTYGEAVAVRDLARERGWHRILLVTNRPHSLRAVTTFRRNTPLEVGLAAVPELDLPALPRHAVWEAAGFVKNVGLGRW